MTGRMSRQDAGVVVLLVLLTAGVFGQAVTFGFVAVDDAVYVASNSRVNRGLTLEGFRWALTAMDASNWHPLAWLSHMLDVSLFGLAPGGHHLTSVLLHAANTVLLYAALQSMSANRWRSAAVAALFAVHPLRAESVAWVAQRKDVLSVFFGLLTVLLFLAHQRRPRPGRYAAAIGAYALGLASKPVLVVLPCALLLMDWWPLGRLRSSARDTSPWRRPLLEKIPFFALAGVAATLTYRAQAAGGSIDPWPLGDRVSNALVSYVRYLWLALRPTRLAVFYPHRLEPWPAAVTALAGLVLLLITALVVSGRRRAPWMPFGWLWYLGTLVPMAGFVQVGGQAMADRYTYLPLVGILLAAVWSTAAWVEARPRLRGPTGLAGAAAILVLGTICWFQVRLWGDSRRLLEHAARVAPGNWFAHSTLGVLLAKEGDPRGAEAQFRLSLAANPWFFPGVSNYALFLFRQERFADARALALRGMELSPEAGAAFGLPNLIAACEARLRARVMTPESPEAQRKEAP